MDAPNLVDTHDDIQLAQGVEPVSEAPEQEAYAYGGAIPGPRLTEDNADDFARRLIAWTFATAPLFQRAAGGEVNYPVAMPTEINEDLKAGKAKLKHLSPQEFLDESDPLEIGKGDRHIIHSFKEHIKSGDHLGPLKLYEEGHQDGRHRANAAKDLGVKKVPVIDYRKADGGAVDDAVDTARNLNPMGFYSAAAEAASKFPQKAPIDQIISKIKGQPNVKQAELDNANLRDAFAGQRSVDPQEVARHLQESVPQIKERVYGGAPAVKYEPKALLERPKGFENTDDVYEVGPQGKPPHLIAVNGNNFDVWGPSGYHNSFDSFNDAVEYANQSIHGVEPTQYSEYTIPGGENYREVVLTLPGEEKYKSSHWPDINPAAHLRMSDRDDGKTLHLEELQSDWGQTGREEGFYDPNREKTDSVLTQMSRDVSSAVPKAPYVTDTNQWVDLGLKRALMEAAKGGYDKLIWTPGEEQKNRYNLSQHVEEVAYEPDEKILSYIPRGGNNGRGHVDIPGDVEPDEIKKHIGKEAAKRLLAAEPNKTSGIQFLRGEDLEVGGHGMKEFYDKLVPQRLNKLVAQYDKDAKVAPHSHSLKGEDGEIKAHSIQITPKLREAILKGGLPAFEHGGSVIDAALDVVSKLRR